MSKTATLPDVKQTQMERIADKARQLQEFFADAGIASAGDATDPQSILEQQLDIALRIANADGEDAILGNTQTISGLDLAGRRFTVTGDPAARPSTKKGGAGFYLQFPVRIIDDTGEVTDTVASCGAVNVMTAMAALHKYGRLVGRDWRIVSITTDSQNTVLRLQRADESGSTAQRLNERAAELGDDAPF